MKLIFVVDDSVMEHALTGTDAHGKANLDASDAICLLFWRCHRIVHNAPLRKKLYSLIEDAVKARIDLTSPNALRALKGFTSRPEKLIYVPDTQGHLPCVVPREDAYVVHAAREALSLGPPGGVVRIVTADAGLYAAVRGCEAFHLSGIHVVTPSEALALLADFDSAS